MLKQPFERRQRLLKAAEYQAVFSKPYKQADRYFSLFIQPNQLDYGRLGLAIAKKRIKTAVQRNRLKRLARESFRCAPELTRGFDIVLMAKFGADEVDNATLRLALTEQWQRLARRRQRYCTTSK